MQAVPVTVGKVEPFADVLKSYPAIAVAVFIVSLDPSSRVGYCDLHRLAGLPAGNVNLKGHGRGLHTVLDSVLDERLDEEFRYHGIMERIGCVNGDDKVILKTDLFKIEIAFNDSQFFNEGNKPRFP